MKGGWKLSDESRKNISEAKKRTWKDPIYRQRMELLYADPERKKRVSEIAKEMLSRPEVKLKLSDIGKKRCEDPVERERLIKILQDPNTVQRKREANAKQSFRENASKKQKEVWKNPDYRESQLYTGAYGLGVT